MSTLKEKFEMEIKNKGNSEILLKYKCSQIADDYAISFAEWIEELSGSHIDSLDYHLYLDNDVKQLLEIFKKEKGL